MHVEHHPQPRVVLTQVRLHSRTTLSALQMILNFSSGITLGAIIGIISQQASPSLYHPTLSPQGELWAMLCFWTQSGAKVSVKLVHNLDDNRETEQ